VFQKFDEKHWPWVFIGFFIVSSWSFHFYRVATLVLLQSCSFLTFNLFWSACSVVMFFLYDVGSAAIRLICSDVCSLSMFALFWCLFCSRFLCSGRLFRSDWLFWLFWYFTVVHCASIEQHYIETRSVSVREWIATWARYETGITIVIILHEIKYYFIYIHCKK